MLPEQLSWATALNVISRPGGTRFPNRSIAAAAPTAAFEDALDEAESWLSSENDTAEVPFAMEVSSACFSSPLRADQIAAQVNDSPNAPSSGAKIADWMDAHALVHSSHRCAMYYREGLEAAGLNTADRPRSGDAADYGPFLLRHGAQVVPAANYNPQVGDTVVFYKTEQHPNGHIEIYDGKQWVSDFVQRGFSPYRDAESTPPFTIYRLTSPV